MAHLIDKDALVAIIERRIEHNTEWKDACETLAFLAANEAIEEDKQILSIINTLEVKEVDLEKETTHYLLHEHRSPLNEIMHKADLKSEMQYHKDIENAFKAGFELGISVSNKAQKGE